MNMMRKAIRSVGRAPGCAALARYVIAVALFPALAGAAERRCGWLENPTPENFSLRDPQGEWVMGEQGGYQADGMDETPDFMTRGWVGTNGNYGYGCACLVALSTAARGR